MTNPLDKSNMRQVILDFPQQFKKALEFAKDVKTEWDFDNVIICGMGGSALPADIVKAYLETTDQYIPITIIRDYDLPASASKNSLVIISSYSGNTEEPVECYQKAKAKKYQLIGLAKTGKLIELCQQDNIPFIQYPDDGPSFQPRYATGYILTSMLSILANSGKVKDITKDIENLAAFLENLNLEEKGKDLAQKIAGATPIIYSTTKYGDSLARIIKIKINENTKTAAFYNTFPELNHNEMQGWANPQGSFHILIFRDPEEHPRNLKRIEITAKLCQDKNIPVEIFDLEGSNTLEKIFSGLNLGDWIAYHLALEYGQDPTPVKMVEDLKIALKD
ncbi:MAG: bifunctional phosphoglucose/phosphomannose isomerase [Parcubacteria group bacterium]|nr:bifunctional phosphoglucose/phosphomannose isomerase [Parcubacteria group bacterium]